MSMVRFHPEAPKQYSKIFADLAHPVERHLAKVEVASSSLVIRSKLIKVANKIISTIGHGATINTLNKDDPLG